MMHFTSGLGSHLIEILKKKKGTYICNVSVEEYFE